MNPAYFTIHPGKNPPPKNGCQFKSNFFFLKSDGFTSSTFPIQPGFSQNQPAAITLNTGSPRTLLCGEGCIQDRMVTKRIHTWGYVTQKDHVYIL
jgi:hypothetical protein